MGSAQKKSKRNGQETVAVFDSRKARTRALIQIGGLAEIAELVDYDPGPRLGGFGSFVCFWRSGAKAK